MRLVKERLVCGVTIQSWGACYYCESSGNAIVVLVLVHVIVLEYQARSGSLSGIPALTLNPAALARKRGVAGRDGN